MKRLCVWVLVTACGSPQHPATKEDPAALADHGLEVAKAGKLDEAAHDFQHAAELGNGDAWNLLAMLRAYRGDDPGAAEAFAHEPPTDPLAKAWFLFAEGELDDALTAARAATIAKEPDHQEYVKAALLQGGLLIELGRFRDAIEPLTTAAARAVEVGLADHPYFRAFPLGLRAWAEINAGDPAADATVAKLDALAAANPDDLMLKLITPVVRGQQAIAKHDLPGAEQALGSCPAFAMCLYWLADVQTQRGETDAAAATRAKITSVFTLSPPEIYYRRRAMH